MGWPLKNGLTNAELQQMLFGQTSMQPLRRRLDYERVHRELARSGVTLSLLWNEYCEGCRLAGDLPLMYTQFCLHYREFAQKTKAAVSASF